jgi:hypothetical protein
MPDEHLDLSSDPGPGEANESPQAARRFLGVHFHCCHLYARVYVNRESTAYVGHCPGCGRRVDFRISPGGTDERFFSAY